MGVNVEIKEKKMICKYFALSSDGCENRLPTTLLYREHFCKNRPDKCPVYNYSGLKGEVVKGEICLVTFL